MLTLEISSKPMYFNDFFCKFGCFSLFGAQTSNDWCIEWPYCITKSLSTVGWLALQTKANELQKKTILQESRCKNWKLVYDIMPIGIIFSPFQFCELLAATCLRFLIVCGCHCSWNWTGRKNHNTAQRYYFLSDKYLCTERRLRR